MKRNTDLMHAILLRVEASERPLNLQDVVGLEGLDDKVLVFEHIVLLEEQGLIRAKTKRVFQGAGAAVILGLTSAGHNFLDKARNVTLPRQGKTIGQKKGEAVTRAVLRSGIQPNGMRENNRWRTIKPLSAGGQGRTFLVTDVLDDSDQRYVLKRFKNVKDPSRFKQEIDVLKGINHPNVIRIIDSDLKAKGPFYVMPYVAEGSMEDHKDKWKGQPVASLRFCASICDGLAAAHQQGITHRDIKPANILVAEADAPIIADFGICYVESTERHTRTNEVVGPRRFTAPELESGRSHQVTPASDVYSLGKVLYWMLTGGQIFNREQFAEPDWDLVSRYRDARYKHINALFARSINYTPGGRFSDAAEFGRQLRIVADLFSAAAPARLEVVTGSGQTAICGTALPEELAVRVGDPEGRGAADAAVWWRGDGSFDPVVSTTDRAGVARTRWRLGCPAGAQSARAEVAELAPAVFSAEARVGAPISIRFAGVPTRAKIGSSHEITVRVEDLCGNLVPGNAPCFSILRNPENRVGLSIENQQRDNLPSGQYAYRVTLGPHAVQQSAYINAAGAKFQFAIEATLD